MEHFAFQQPCHNKCRSVALYTSMKEKKIGILAMQTSYERMSFTAYLVPDKSGRFFFIVVFLPVLGFCFCRCSYVSMSDITVASIYAVTAPFVKYLQVPACPCCFFLSFADHNLPRSLCLEIALPNPDIHPCTKMRELLFPGLAGWVCAELPCCVQGSD